MTKIVVGRCTLCKCPADGILYGFRVCPYHREHGEDAPPCPVCNHPPECAHDWQEQPGEPPIDVCPLCGATRE